MPGRTATRLCCHSCLGHAFHWRRNKIALLLIVGFLLLLLSELATAASKMSAVVSDDISIVKITDKNGKIYEIPVPKATRHLEEKEDLIKAAIEMHYSQAAPNDDEEHSLVWEAFQYWREKDHQIMRQRLVENVVLGQLFDSVGGTPALVNRGLWTKKDADQHDWSYPLKPYCDWYGVHCAIINKDDEVPVVVAINLSNQDLDGTLPTELNYLEHLRTLNLAYNRLQGTIPSELFAMPSLRHLLLYENRFTGTFPLFESTMVAANVTSSLQTLNLLNNHLSGVLPASDWHPRLTSLRHLDLSRNHFTGTFPTNQMSERFPLVMSLWLGCNILTGTLPNDPAEWGDWSKSLDILDLGSNALSGTIPSSLASLSSLSALILADNDFRGHIPQELFQMSTLWTLQLQNNHLSGTIPAGTESLGWANLTELGALFLRYNELTGTIPASFYLGQKSCLRHVDLSYNKLTGTIATEIGIMTKLHTISAMGNQLRGTLPNEMVNMEPNLRLNFSDNLLTGTIPSLFCGHGTVNMLYREFGCDAVLCRPGTFSWYGHATLHSACRPCPPTAEGEAKDPPESTVLGRVSCESVEFVNGDLNGDGILSPREILRMTYVDTLGRFWGPTFQTWADMSVNECDLAGIKCNGSGQIVEIDFSGANLCSDGDRRPGPIQFCKGLPPELGQITTLELLDVENREFLRGSIPTEFGKLTRLKSLQFSGCNALAGTIPSELGNLSKLRLLQITHSQVSGSIPSELFQLHRIGHIRLTNNRLTGTLSTHIGNLDDLEELMISRNRLKGTIPSEIGQLGRLENFEAYHNSFTGTIPSEIAQCSNLKRIDLFNNKLVGSIPSEFPSLSLLQIIHLKNNLITGTIPSEFGTLSFLSWFDVTSNQLHGTIPPSFGSSQSIKDFHLGGNMFYDPIPPGLCTNKNINNEATEDFGCEGVLCSLGSYSKVGYAVDEQGCTKCPEGETTLYLGSTKCEALTEADVLSIFFEVMQGNEWPYDMKVNWGDPTVSPCEWSGITCDNNGEVVSLSFPLQHSGV